MTKKTRKLLREEVELRISQKTCPKCRKHDISYIELGIGFPLPKKYKLKCKNVWACNGPDGPFCYFMSGDMDCGLFESSEGTVPVDEGCKSSKPQLIIGFVRRRRGDEEVLIESSIV